MASHKLHSVVIRLQESDIGVAITCKPDFGITCHNTLPVRRGNPRGRGHHVRHFLIQTSLKHGRHSSPAEHLRPLFTAEDFGRIQGGDAQTDMADIAIRREVVIREEHSPAS